MVDGGQGRSSMRCVRSELLLADREDVASRENEVLLAVVLHLGAAVLAVQHDVAGLDVERQALAVLEAARAHGQDDALLGLLLGGVRDDQARGGGLARGGGAGPNSGPGGLGGKTLAGGGLPNTPPLREPRG